MGGRGGRRRGGFSWHPFRALLHVAVVAAALGPGPVGGGGGTGRCEHVKFLVSSRALLAELQDQGSLRPMKHGDGAGFLASALFSNCAASVLEPMRKGEGECAHPPGGSTIDAPPCTRDLSAALDKRLKSVAAILHALLGSLRALVPGDRLDAGARAVLDSLSSFQRSPRETALHGIRGDDLRPLLQQFFGSLQEDTQVASGHFTKDEARFEVIDRASAAKRMKDSGREPGAFTVLGDKDEVQLLVEGLTNQRAELFQVSSGGSRKLSVSGAGEVFVAGKLVSDDDQEAGGLGDAAIVTSGGISAGKSAILGGKLNVRDTSDASTSSMGSIFTAGGMQVTKKLLVGDEVAVGLGKAAGTGARSLKIWSESDGIIQVRSGKNAASRVELLNGQQRAFMENRNGTFTVSAGGGAFEVAGGPTVVSSRLDSSAPLPALLVQGGMRVARNVEIQSNLKVGGRQQMAKLHLESSNSDALLQVESKTMEANVVLKAGPGRSRIQSRPGTLTLSADESSPDGVLELLHGPQGRVQITWGRLASDSHRPLTVSGAAGVSVAAGRDLNLTAAMIRLGNATHSLLLEGSELASSGDAPLVFRSPGHLHLHGGKSVVLGDAKGESSAGILMATKRAMRMEAAAGVQIDTGAAEFDIRGSVVSSSPSGLRVSSGIAAMELQGNRVSLGSSNGGLTVDERGTMVLRAARRSIVLDANDTFGGQVVVARGHVASGDGQALRLTGQHGAQLVAEAGAVVVSSGSTVALEHGADGEVGVEVRGGGARSRLKAPAGRGLDLVAEAGVRLKSRTAVAGEVPGTTVFAGAEEGFGVTSSTGISVAAGGTALRLLPDEDLSVTLAAGRALTVKRSGKSEACLKIDGHGKLSVAEGLLAGTAALVAGTVTIGTPAVGSKSIVMITMIAPGGDPAPYHAVTSKTEGSNFVISGIDGHGNVVASDFSTLSWYLVDAF